MENVKPVCGYCGKQLKGRSDKKFCNDSCRNAFNHRQKEAENTDFNFQSVISILKKNRAILVAARKDTKTNKYLVATEKYLLAKGFNFQYCTEHIRYNEYDHYFCFDVGYVIKEPDKCELLNRSAFQFEMEINDPDFDKPVFKVTVS